MSKYLCNTSCSKKVTYIIQILIMTFLIVLGTFVYTDSKGNYVEATPELQTKTIINQ